MVSQALATQSYEPSAAMPSAPTHIGRFEVRSEIGRGSNGVVYAAFDPVLGRELAIKAIPLAADNLMRRRAEASFLQEAKSAASLNHPGIVTVFDAGKTESVAYIAMERLYGSDLHDWLATRDRLAELHVARAGAGARAGCAQRRVLDGLDPVRVADRAARLRRKAGGGNAHQGRLAAADSDLSAEPGSAGRADRNRPSRDGQGCSRSLPERGRDAQRPGDGGRARGLRPAPHAATRDFRAAPVAPQPAPVATSSPIVLADATSTLSSTGSSPSGLDSGVHVMGQAEAPVKPLFVPISPTPSSPVKSRPKAAASAPLAQVAPAPPALPAPLADGSVTLAIAPWGEIIVDGTSLGVSPPLTHLTLAAGAHTIEVHSGAATPFLSRIDVRPGLAVEVQHRF